MQYIDLRRYSRDEIIQLLDMNKAILSITDDLNYATNKGQEKIWWQTGNIPKCRAIEEGISWQFLKNDPNIKVMFDLSTVDALQEDFKEKTEIARLYWAMGISFNTINERLNLGFDGDIPGADVGYLPLSFMPVEGRDYVPEPELLPQMPPEEPTIQKLMPPINIEVKYLDIINLKSKEWETRSEKCWKRVTNEVSKIEIPFAKKIQKVFFEFRKNMLSVLNTGSPKKNKSDIVIKRDSLEAINDINEYTANIERALMQKYSIGYFDLGVTQGIDTLINEIGGNRIQVTDPLITSYFLAKQTKIVSVIDTIKHAIEHQMKLGAMEGEDVVKLEARIKKVFGVADRRAHVIARTEMGGAMNFGRYAQINTSSFKNKVWFTALDERVRGVDGENVPFNHADMHGKKLQIGVTSHWDVNGESLDYPGDYKGSASNIIQCRCIETVDIEDI